jgi:glycosyltransferase involved in cell wall biosynthesis
VSIRVLYVYPEEWTGRRAREIQTLKTCLALADAGAGVDLVTAGGSVDDHARALGREARPRSLSVVALSRRLGPLRSARFFGRRLARWLPGAGPHIAAYVIHPKAAAMLAALRIPYWYEAHEVFAESRPPGTRAASRVERLERETLARAAGCVATSEALAQALNTRYFPTAPLPFAVVPNAGDPPLPRPAADPGGPLVYAGSLGDWKGVPIALEAAARLALPVRLVGGDEQEWARLAARLGPAARANVAWRRRVPARDLPGALAGCRAGLIPTLPETGSGRYSCPMKLFDYARCGLPVVVTDLASLRSLGPGRWCIRVGAPRIDTWAAALSRIPSAGADALEWAAAHTWSARAAALLRLFSRA